MSQRERVSWGERERVRERVSQESSEVTRRQREWGDARSKLSQLEGRESKASERQRERGKQEAERAWQVSKLVGKG